MACNHDSVTQAQRGPLTPEQLGELASATLTNSIELLRDAEGLAIFGRYPRAYSLAVLAAEEFGKHMMCFGAVGRESVDPEAWPTFWKKFLSHNPKYENAVAMAMSFLPPEAGAQFAEKFEEHVSADQKRRLDGFYVDWKNGAIVTPDSVVTDELVSDLLSVFTTVIYSWADHWQGTDFGQMFGQAESSASLVQKALLTGDAQEVAKALRETLGTPAALE
jgi:AbiV family abortive infection protein